jgi:multidrug resistance efflux pump
MSDRPPIFSLADQSAAWERFAQPADSDAFFQSWLALLCAQIGPVEAAMLLLTQGGDGSYAPAAIWPDPSRNLKYLANAAQTALTERRGVVVGADGVSPVVPGQAAQVAYPVEAESQLVGAVVLDLPPASAFDLQKSLRQLHWASAWLQAHFCRQALAQRDDRLAAMATCQALLATALADERLQPSALAVINDLSKRLHCDRVSLGFEQHGQVEVVALSNTADFDRKSDLVRLIAQAMDEVVDLDVALVWPQTAADDLVALAHGDAARAFGDVAMCSVPLVDDGHACGVLTLERVTGQPFSDAEVDLVKTIGLMLGPVLLLKRSNERSIAARLVDSARGAARALFGPEHPGVKLIAVLALALLLVLTLLTVDHRVAANLVIEGEVQRAAAAPFDGFIAESLVRAGDAVVKGQTLVRLDERDLRLEQSRWTAERDQAQSKYRSALAAQDRAAMAVVAAEVNQADAQLQLVEEKLARATVVAPFDGVVVAGDLSQMLGTPVEVGKVLFEVAPRERFRVILEVDERDIAFLQQGQAGELMLSALPGGAIHFTVKQITPVSTPVEGRNHFRVEAQLDSSAAAGLRPGMQGVGKVLVGRARLIWIWTHSATDWLRLSVWNWLP